MKNFGGIGEVYLYGNPKSGGNYDDIDTTAIPFNAAEDGYRVPDGETPLAIDGGSYWYEDEENNYFTRPINGGTFNISMSVVRNDSNIGGLRYLADHNPTVSCTSTDFTTEMIGYYSEEIKEQIEAAQRQQLAEFIIKALITIVVVAVVTYVTLGLGSWIVGSIGGGWLTSAVVTAAFGVSTVMKAAAVAGTVALILTGSAIVGIFNPAYANFAMNLLQITDILAAVIVHGICELMDWTGAMLKGGPENNIHWWRRNVQPGMYSLYCYTLDAKGTAQRLLTAAWSSAWLGGTPEDHIVLDPWERALLAGESYNFLDIDGYFS